MPGSFRPFSALFGRFQPRIEDIPREGFVSVVWIAIVMALTVSIVYLHYRLRTARGKMVVATLMILFMGMVILLLAIPSHLSSPSLSSFTDPEVRRVRVGSYDTAILKPRTAGDLQAWLASNGFAPLSAEGEKVAKAVVRDGWWLVASQLRRDVPGTGPEMTPHPIEVHFPSPAPVYPLRSTRSG